MKLMGLEGPDDGDEWTGGSAAILHVTTTFTFTLFLGLIQMLSRFVKSG